MMSLEACERLVEGRKGLDAISIRKVSGDSMSDFDFESAYRFYVQASLLDARMIEELVAARRQAANTWTSLHRRGSELAFSLVATNQRGHIEGAISAIRAWDHALLVQHLAALPGATRGLGIAIMQAWFDHVRPWTKADHLAFFVNVKNPSMNSFHEKLLRDGQAEGVTRAFMTAWSRPVDSPSAEETVQHPIRILDGIDEPLVSEAACRQVGRAAASALGFFPGQFSLPRTTASFGDIGIVRRRSLATLADLGGTPRMAMIDESTSPGVNMTSFLSSVWVVPLANELSAADVRSVASYMKDRGGSGGGLVLTSGGTHEAAFERAGFTKAYETYLYVANRSGMFEYDRYIRRRYRGLTQTLRRRAGKGVGR
jgi:hypothetical protein